MTAQDLMSRDIAACTSEDDAATAIRLMQHHRCGFVPVINIHGAVAGVVTDRDLCIAAPGARPRTIDHVAVKDVMSSPVVSCMPEEDLTTVLGTMAKHHVHRLPVLNDTGHLQGVLSIDDIIQAAGRPGSPTAGEIVDALKGICARRSLSVPAA